MAIKKAIKFKGLSIKDAYVRVDRIFGGKREGWNSVVAIYASAESSVTDEPIETFNVTAPYVEGELPYVAIYNSVKTQERFTGSTDV